MKRLSLFLILPLLSACFFTQEQPKKNMSSEQSFLFGSIVFQDFQISNQVGQSTVVAQYFKPTEKKTKPVDSLLDESRASKCQSEVVDVKTSRSTDELIFVGDVYFGLANQGNFTKLQRSKENLYMGIFEPNPPAYIYQVIAAGYENIPSFSGLLSMPEQLDWVRLNGEDFGSPAMEYHRGDKLEVSWREPKQENSENRILILFLGKSDKQEFALQCESYESDFMTVSGSNTWSIDSSFLRDLPKDSKVGIHIIRRNIRKSEGQSSALAVEGRRRFYTTMDLIEN